MGKRRRFSEREVIETLIRQGVEVRCYRTKSRITLVTVGLLEREHLTELALGGADGPSNCAYSLKSAHAEVTNGSAATSAGSSKQRIAKTKRLVKSVALHAAIMSGEAERPVSRMRGRDFPKRQRSFGKSAGFRKLPPDYYTSIKRNEP